MAAVHSPPAGGGRRGIGSKAATQQQAAPAAGRRLQRTTTAGGARTAQQPRPSVAPNRRAASPATRFTRSVSRRSDSVAATHGDSSAAHARPSASTTPARREPARRSRSLPATHRTPAVQQQGGPPRRANDSAISPAPRRRVQSPASALRRTDSDRYRAATPPAGRATPPSRRHPSPAARHTSPAARHRPPGAAPTRLSSAAAGPAVAGSRVRLQKYVAPSGAGRGALPGQQGTVLRILEDGRAEVRLDGGGVFELYSHLYAVVESRRPSRAPSARRRSPVGLGKTDSGNVAPPQPPVQVVAPPRLGLAGLQRRSSQDAGQPQRDGSRGPRDEFGPGRPSRVGGRSITAAQRAHTPQRAGREPPRDVGRLRRRPGDSPAPAPQRYQRSRTHSHPPAGTHDGARRSTARAPSPGKGRAADRLARSLTHDATPAPAPAPSPATPAGVEGSSLQSPNYAPGIDPELAKNPSYQTDGYLPAATGATLRDRRYKLLAPLGAGQSSTVWLARDKRREDDDDYAFVAIKVTKCSDNVRISSRHEVSLIDWIQRNSPNRSLAVDLGSALLLDAFEHAGPHGNHVCMVFEVLGPTLDTLMEKWSFRGIGNLPLVKGITRSMLSALDELSRMNVVHTDLKPENVLFKRPAPNVRRIIQHQLHPESTGDTLREAERETPQDEAEVKLSDFGLSYLLSPPDGLLPNGSELTEHDRRLIHASNYQKGAVIQTREYRAPEIVLGIDFGPKTDIWSLACVVFEMVTGEFLFDPKTHSHVTDEISMDREHLAEMAEVIGSPDPEWIRSCDGAYLSRYFDEDGVFKPDPRRPSSLPPVDTAAVLQSHTRDRAETEQLQSFLTLALRWNPAERPSASELLQHPWLAGGPLRA
eukprot:TRINITY_DN60214_c0_g1_i1.p1 TRINITY_DN60214_c0_g1~~TRINITY_DN60214_c0_g1_i1.p1  ORF type:complete len:901 (+),score=177.24 TRINITY_DN60214_c0_g1_i1:83-2704(+)